ncbi:MAG: toll/interleukin-1 receptor domain-containing protein [Bacteroidetes bacterium]|nr:toll/interleukin-1 receptor domain-containing protein [Bacteroidota bacterium]
MSNDVFISYSSIDEKIAKRICTQLKEAGIRFWLSSASIKAGEKFPQQIIRALNNSKIFLLIFSFHSNRSKYVLREIERAVHKNIPIIPFKIEENFNLSEEMEFFLMVTQWFEAYEPPPVDEHIDELITVIKSILDIKKVPEDTDPQFPAGNDDPGKRETIKVYLEEISP